MMKIGVKWGKNKFNDLEVESNESIFELKAKLFTLTNVLPEN